MTDAPVRIKPPLTARTILLLALAALVIPVVSVVCWLIGVAAAPPSGALEGFAPYFCRRGTCVGDADATIRSSVGALAGMLLYTFGIAAVGLVLALLTRRRGWVTIPAIIFYVIVLIVSVNTAAFVVTGGAQIPGAIVIAVAAFGIPIAVVALARLALPTVWGTGTPTTATSPQTQPPTA